MLRLRLVEGDQSSSSMISFKLESPRVIPQSICSEVRTCARLQFKTLRTAVSVKSKVKSLISKRHRERRRKRFKRKRRQAVLSASISHNLKWPLLRKEAIKDNRSMTLIFLRQRLILRTSARWKRCQSLKMRLNTKR